MSDAKSQLFTKAEALLNRQEARLLREIDVEMRASHDELDPETRVPGDAAPDDQAVRDAVIDLNLAGVERQVHELRLIEAARSRLRDGTFGKCRKCSHPIAASRLMAFPHAELCVQCQQRAESPHRVSIDASSSAAGHDAAGRVKQSRSERRIGRPRAEVDHKMRATRKMP
jgi:RNA polymerase-binding transcription factor DksA